MVKTEDGWTHNADFRSAISRERPLPMLGASGTRLPLFATNHHPQKHSKVEIPPASQHVWDA